MVLTSLRPCLLALGASVLLHNLLVRFDNCRMTEKEIVIETIRSLPDNCSLDDIAERIEFMAAVRKGLDQLDRGEGIPHEEVKKQLASWLIS
jgi:hypothetical protein